jgi:hypothetical protein
MKPAKKNLEMQAEVWFIKSELKNQMGDIDDEGRIILKWIYK